MLDSIPTELLYIIANFDNYEPNNLACVSKTFNNILRKKIYNIKDSIIIREYDNLNCIYIILDDIEELSQINIANYLKNIMTKLLVVTNNKKINVKLSSNLDCGCEHYYVYIIFNGNYKQLNCFSKYCNYKPHRKYVKQLVQRGGGGLFALVAYGAQNDYLY